MKKDAYYFSHDANAQDDHKCMELIDQLGMEGYGIFWALIEKLRCEKEYKLPMTVCKSYAKRWGTSEQKIIAVITNYQLFEINDSTYYSLRLCRSMNEKSEKAKLSASYRWGNNAVALQPHTECNTDGMQNDAIKVKESKEKESKENNKGEEYSPELLDLNEKCKKYFKSEYVNKKSIEVFDKLIRLDKYTIKDIQMAILNAKNSDFWNIQFLTPVKLRNTNKDGVKYIDIFLKLKSELPKPEFKSPSSRKLE